MDLKLPAVICDLDGTLADTAHRQHFVRDGRKDWGSFFEAQKDDKPREKVVRILKHFERSTTVILIVSARPALYREFTLRWLVWNAIPFDYLFMRESDDRRLDIIVKSEMYEKEIRPKYDVFMAIDDRPNIIRLWRESYGIFTLDVGDGIDF